MAISRDQGFPLFRNSVLLSEGQTSVRKDFFRQEKIATLRACRWTSLGLPYIFGYDFYDSEHEKFFGYDARKKKC